MIETPPPAEQTQQPQANANGVVPPTKNSTNKWFGIHAFVVCALFGLSVMLGLFFSKALSQMPDVKMLSHFQPNQSTQIYDRYNQLIANIHGDEDRVVVPLSEISPYLTRAVLATEDNRFYEHFGIDPKGTARAVVTNLLGRDNVQGGSSITQQLVKNLFLTPEKSYKRKIAEAVLAIRVEGHYSKNKILEMYLNQVYFGNQSYGAEKAARRYFKKPARNLTLAQAALLAGLLQAPEALSPYSNPKGARARQLEVLQKMLNFGYITYQQYQKAAPEKIVLNSRQTRPSKYPYYVAYVIQELEARYGRDVVRRGGLKVYTTLDPTTQEKAQQVLENAIKKAPKGSHIEQGAFVAMDVKTGQLLALVGGTNYQQNQFNSATQARRAVGSTFKPFVYLTAIRLGLITPKTKICDRPVSYGNWAPKNWDGRYMGCMDVRRALALSRNTPTVQIGMKTGVDAVIETSRMAGIHSYIDPNPSSFLGSSGVSPLELVTAYSTFARGGVYRPAKSIQKVLDGYGNQVAVDDAEPKVVFEPDHVATLIDILIDVVDHGTGINAKLKDRVVAGKTGTTDEVRDIWFMGFTPDLVAGVWLGHPQNIPLKGVFSSYAAQAWHDVVDSFYTNHPRPPQPFYTASNEFAAINGLIHLIDAKGVAEAKKALAAKGTNLDENNGLAPNNLTTRSRRVEVKDDDESEEQAPFSVKVDGKSVELDPAPAPATTKPVEPAATTPSKQNNNGAAAPLPPPLPPLN